MTEDETVRLWAPLAYAIADRYYMAGADRADVRQEALVGLLKALRTWDPARSSLRTFVSLCVERQVIAKVRQSQARKHALVTAAVRVVGIDATDAVEYGRSALGRDPHLVLVEKLELSELADRAMRLTNMERRAIGGVLAGFSYCEIEGVPEGVKPKWVDNAVQRARKKLAA